MWMLTFTSPSQSSRPRGLAQTGRSLQEAWLGRGHLAEVRPMSTYRNPIRSKPCLKEC